LVMCGFVNRSIQSPVSIVTDVRESEHSE